MCTFGVLGLSCEAPAAPRERRKKEISGLRGKKKSEILGGPGEGRPREGRSREGRSREGRVPGRRSREGGPGKAVREGRSREGRSRGTKHTQTDTNTHKHKSKSVWPKSVLAKVGHTTKTLTLAKVGLAKLGHQKGLAKLGWPKSVWPKSAMTG